MPTADIRLRMENTATEIAILSHKMHGQIYLGLVQDILPVTATVN